jgi:hypothetical protein
MAGQIPQLAVVFNLDDDSLAVTSATINSIANSKVETGQAA